MNILRLDSRLRGNDDTLTPKTTMSQSQAQSVIESAVQNQPKKRGCRRGCQGCLIAIVILAVPLVWFNIPSPLRVSKETTYVLGPMTSDGKRIDYFRAMEERFYPPEMKTDDNGFRMMVRAMGASFPTERRVQDPNTLEWITVEFDPEPLQLQVYEKLGLDPSIEPTLTLVSATVFIERHAREASSKFNNASRGLWTFDDFPMLQEWYDENTAGIDLLGEAVRKPVFRIPFVRENENVPFVDAFFFPSDKFQIMRDWARAAHARATYRLGIGDIDGAIDDIMTIRHLGRHAIKHGTLVMGLMGIAIEGMGISIGIGSNPEFPPTKEQIERLMREIESLPPRYTLNEVLESERFFALATMQDMYGGNHSGNTLNQFLLMPLMGLTIDINVALARLNKVHDSLLVPGATIDGKTLEEFLDPSRQSWNPLPFFSKRNRTNRIMDSMIALLLPAMQAAREAWRRIECCANLHRLTLALLLYELEHGQLPAGDWREAIKTADGRWQMAEVFRCPGHPGLAEDETTYAMIGDVPNAMPSPMQILLVEVWQPQKLGEGDGRIAFEKAKLWGRTHVFATRPDDFDGVGSHHAGVIVAGFRSGAVRIMADSMATGMNPEVWQSLLDGTAETLP